MKFCKTLVESVIVLGATTTALWAAPLGTAFNYQGRLDQNGQPAPDGIYYMYFTLHDALSSGNQLASQPTNAVPVTNGLFGLELDFGGSAFSGEERWLQINLRTNGGVATNLTPRVHITPAPNAIYASTAGTVTNGAIQATQLGTAGAPPSAGQVLSYDGTRLVWQGAAAASGAWSVNGNSVAPGQFVGTTGNQPLEVRVNNARALRLEPDATSPNVIGGWSGNVVDAGVSGATIAGGGALTQFSVAASNRITDNFGTIGGGAHNLAGNTNATFTDAYFATVGGGHFNSAKGTSSTVAGGANNEAQAENSAVAGGYLNLAKATFSTIAGGTRNTASGDYSTIGGGERNECDGKHATVAGGYDNVAIGLNSTVGGGEFNAVLAGGGDATVGGGYLNSAYGEFSTIPGGYFNSATGHYAFAAGSGARADHDGSFVWSDRNFNSPFEFHSTTTNEFAVRASGGLRLDTDTSMYFGSQTRQMLNLWDTQYGVGVQAATLYFRTHGAFAWHRDGSHVDGVADAGPGGVTLMTLDDNAGLVVNASTTTKVLTITGGADLAEPFTINEEKIDKGSVVIIDEEHPGQLKRSTRAYDTRVAGIVSGANGINPGIALKQEGALDHGENVALTGRVYVKADASYGAIKPGDLLTTSDTPGHAMKVLDHARTQGAILGKAMSALGEGKGFVLVLVTLQ